MLAALTLTLAGCGRPSAKLLDLTFSDMNGQPVKLSDFKGRPILLNFWGTWCGPCKKEIPDLIALHEKYKDQGLVIVGVALNDEAADLRAYAASHHIPYPILLGDPHQDFIDAYQANLGVPTSWFIHRDGTLGEKRLGLGTFEYFDAQIRKIL